jgi:hypothetical protein
MSYVMRPGKTRREHSNGVWSRHLANQEKRRTWNQQYASGAKSGGLKVIAYPVIGF